MKNIIAVFTLVLCWNISSAQISIERQVIGAAGFLSAPGTLQSSITVGEIFTATSSQETLIITQGFQQPDTLIHVGLKSPDNPITRFSIYPNPTMDRVILEFVLDQPMKIGIDIYNQFGQQLTQNSELSVRDNFKQELDFSGFPAGNYFVVVKSANGSLYKGFKVQKVD
jgi:hypothetical protein